jgi:hypothetical protein
MCYRTVAGLIVALVASSGWSLAAAKPAAVEVSLVSVTPGTPSGDGDWCVGAERVTITARVVDLETQSEVTEGLVWLQLCLSSAGVFPKEDCDALPGAPRWQDAVGHDLSVVNPPFFTINPAGPVAGVRFRYVPAPGGAFKRATSASFNLDRTCSP